MARLEYTLTVFWWQKSFVYVTVYVNDHIARALLVIAKHSGYVQLKEQCVEFVDCDPK